MRCTFEVYYGFVIEFTLKTIEYQQAIISDEDNGQVGQQPLKNQGSINVLDNNIVLTKKYKVSLMSADMAHLII